MAALTVSDWTNIAVAIGTFLLAVATYSATVVARHSTREAYRSRVDATAPRLVVLDVKVQQGLEKYETVTAGNFGFADAGEPIDVMGIGEGKLGLFAVVEIFNDGNSSAYVDLVRPPDVYIKEITYLGSKPGRLEHFYDSGVIFLQRDTRVSVKLVWRQSATAWSEEPNFPNELPTRNVTIRSSDTLGSMMDRCTVTLGGFGLMRTPSNPGGWNVAPRNLFTLIPQGGPNAVERIGPCDRSYPKEQTVNSRWTKLRRAGRPL
jgi:hypothetical protein